MAARGARLSRDVGWIVVTVSASLAVAAAPACKKNGDGSEESPRATDTSAPEPATTQVKPDRSAAPRSVPAPADVAAPPASAEKAEDGLASVVLAPGSGSVSPKNTDRVKLHYTGWKRDGSMTTSTTLRSRPHTLSMERLMAGWEGQALSSMVAGEKRRFWVPQDAKRAGFSRQGNRNEPVTFEVELVEVIEVPLPPPVPADVAAPPKDAKRTKSGMSYKVLSKGTGTVHPKAEQRVDVHYTGWTTDGKMFDSSIPRGKPSTFSLNQVIKGWTEGVQLMVEGEKTRFWIPGELAYGDAPSRPGAPAGTLVFNIELVKLR